LVNNSLQLYSINLVDVLFGLIVLFESRWINIEREREREREREFVPPFSPVTLILIEEYGCQFVLVIMI
jgi:hypothetical protein